MIYYSLKHTMNMKPLQRLMRRAKATHFRPIKNQLSSGSCPAWQQLPNDTPVLKLFRSGELIRIVTNTEYFAEKKSFEL